jgi:hypothetical protein
VGVWLRVGDLVRTRGGGAQRLCLLIGLERDSALAAYAVLMSSDNKLCRIRNYVLLERYEVISSVRD